MADKKISALTGASTPLAGTEVLPIVQGGATVKVAVSDLTAGRVVSMSNLGVGVASPTYLADIQGTSGPSARIRSTPSTAGTATLLLEVANNFSGTSQSYVQGIGPGGSGISQLAFGVSTTSGATTATEVYRIDNTGNLLPKIAGNGVNFTANTPASGMTSQLLNWYEEGTWTPNPVIGWTNVGTKTVTGKYIRIGSQVICWGSMQYTISMSSAGGNTRITGMPFVVNANFKGTPVLIGLDNTITLGNGFFGETTNGIYCPGFSTTTAAVVFQFTYFV